MAKGVTQKTSLKLGLKAVRTGIFPMTHDQLVTGNILAEEPPPSPPATSGPWVGKGPWSLQPCYRGGVQKVGSNAPPPLLDVRFPLLPSEAL